jgi:hypothetical protein
MRVVSWRFRLLDCKLGRNGSLQLEESFGGSSADYGGSGYITKDYGYVMAGSSYSNDGDVSGNHGNSDTGL